MLKFQERKMMFLVNFIVTSLVTRLKGNLASYKFHLTKVPNFDLERHDLLEKLMQTSKESVESEVKEIHDMFLSVNIKRLMFLSLIFKIMSMFYLMPLEL